MTKRIDDTVLQHHIDQLHEATRAVASGICQITFRTAGGAIYKEFYGPKLRLQGDGPLFIVKFEPLERVVQYLTQKRTPKCVVGTAASQIINGGYIPKSKNT